MLPIRTILLVVSLVLFILAAGNVTSGRINLTAAGLVFLVAALLIAA